MPIGAPAAALLALLASGPAAAVTLTEPTVDTFGTPLANWGADGLWACIFTVPGSPAPFWLRPASPAGGGVHELPVPAQTGQLPYAYEAQCLNRSGWGPKVRGTLGLTLTVENP